MRMEKEQIRKIWGGVFDDTTIYALYKLLSKGQITEINSIIKEGKESLILSGRKGARKVAIKVFAIGAANFTKMQPYILGDPRFKRIKRDHRSLVFAWCQKEFKNLQRAARAGVRCPEPLAVLENVLVMEFIGKDAPAPRIKDVGLVNRERTFAKVVDYMRKLHKADLVHGDLSEYNILMVGNEPVFIDFSQAVLLEHPQSDGMVRRDVKNVCNFFRNRGIVTDENEVYKKVTGKEL